MKVKDNKDITNYTFSILLADAPQNEFYNLIQTEDAKGNLSNPYVIKYVVDAAALDDYLANNRNFSYFKGKKVTMSFSDFFDNVSLISNRSSTCGETETPIDNTQPGFSGGLNDIPSTNDIQISGGGSYTTTSQGPVAGYSHRLTLNTYDASINQTTTSYSSVVINDSSPTPATTVSSLSVGGVSISADLSITAPGLVSFNVTVNTYPGSPYSGGGVPTEGGLGGHKQMVVSWGWSDGTVYVQTIPITSNTSQKYSISSKGEGCFDAENGLVGILGDDSVEENLANRLGLSSENHPEMWSWLTKYEHEGALDWQLLQIISYLDSNKNEQNSISPEAIEFALAAIEAMTNGGDIDLENRLIYNPLIAQDYRAKMSSAEEVIFDSMNNFQKEGYLRAATQAYIYAETHFQRPVRNTKGDTFKHTFWNALSTVYIGETLTEQLTTAHEDIEYDPNYQNHFKETQMDLFNNSQGRQLAYGAGRLYQLVQNALDSGNLRYLSNLEFINGFWRATNSSQLIPSNE